MKRVIGQPTPEQHLLERILSRENLETAWKRWRWCRTKIRKLLKLGTELGTAIRAGLNRNGPWAMARRLAAHSGMTNQWLKDQGLVSVKEPWVKIHYPATAR